MTDTNETLEQSMTKIRGALMSAKLRQRDLATASEVRLTEPHQVRQVIGSITSAHETIIDVLEAMTTYVAALTAATQKMQSIEKL